MQEMTLTFEWTDRGCRGRIVASRQFPVKDEARVREDVEAWVREMYEADGGQHEHFEVGRKFIGVGGQRCTWIVYGTKTKFNWNVNFMSWAENFMVCTLAYLGWERDVNHANGYRFVNISNGDHMLCNSLEEIDEFIKSEMRRVSEEG